MKRRASNVATHELRVFSADGLEMREDESGRTFRGHAAVFNSLSQELWGFHERIDPDAFASALAGEDDVRFLINHDPTLLLARSKSGTLKLEKDDRGLIAEAQLPDTSYARDLATMMDRGSDDARDIDQMSFGFRTIEDDMEDQEIELPDGSTVVRRIRTLLQVELFDVSVVTFPAYLQTDAELNSAYRYLGAVPLGAMPTPPADPVAETVTEAAASAGLSWSYRDGVWYQGGSSTSDAQLRFADFPEWEERLIALAEERAGKVLSAKNLSRVKQALASLREMVDEIEDESDDEANAYQHELEHRRRHLDLMELA